MPISFRISVNPPADDITSRTRSLRDVLQRNTLSALRKQVKLLVGELEAATPRSKGTVEGRKRLAESWFVTESGLSFNVINDLHASNGRSVLNYVLHGNDPGDGYITPKNARALAFTIDGTKIVRRRVRAYQGKDFVTPVLERWIPSAEGAIKTSVRVTGTWLLTGGGSSA